MKTYKIKVNGKLYEVQLEAVSESNECISTQISKPAQSAPATESVESNIVYAPIAGKVLKLNVNVGDTVKKGQTVAIIEAMKLENEIPATSDGKILEIKVSVGAMVENKQVIIVLG